MPGQLIVLATPLGNLGDLSQRALAALKACDLLVCEDTRTAQALLGALGIAGKPLEAFHKDSKAGQEDAIVKRVLSRIARGESVVLTSDAGTPGVSDPGARLVAAMHEAGALVTTVPGPSIVAAAVSVSGFGESGFVFSGFFPRKESDRKPWLEAALEFETVVVLEAPTRIHKTAEWLAAEVPEIMLCAVKELTKIHEVIVRGTPAELVDYLRDQPAKGEWCLVLYRRKEKNRKPKSEDELGPASVTKTFELALASGARLSDLARGMSQEFGAPKSQWYDLGLTLTKKK